MSLRTKHLRRIGIFRALMLGDMLCATPALRALRAACPEAHITLIGLPWASELAGRLTSVDDFEPFPGWPGLPEIPQPPAGEMQAFVGRVRARSLDLLIQMHGSGRLTNALLSELGARHRAGFFEQEGHVRPEDKALWMEWPRKGNEITRLLGLTSHLGFAPQGTALDLPLESHDYVQAQTLIPSSRRYVVVHAGSQLPSRRWHAQSFAAVGDSLAEAGYEIVLTGTAGERPVVASVANSMKHSAFNACGATNIWTLGALLASARLLVCNDTGLSHMAAALGTPSVIAACGSEVERWAPLDAFRHRVLWRETHCRPCAHRICPIGHHCATDLVAEEVARVALDLADRSAG